MWLRAASARSKRTVREILAEASTGADSLLWRDFSGFDRFRFTTSGLIKINGNRSEKRQTKDRLDGATSSRSGERRNRVKSQEGRVAYCHAVLTVLTRIYFLSKFLAIPVIIANERTKKYIYNDNNNITVRKYNGTEWINVGSRSFSTGAIDYPSIAIDSNDTPYVAFNNQVMEGMEGKATVMKYTGAGMTGWELIGNAGFSTGTASSKWSGIKIAIDNNDVPYVAYPDEGNGGKPTVMKYDGSSWVPVGKGILSEGRTYFISPAFPFFLEILPGQLYGSLICLSPAVTEKNPVSKTVFRKP